jgi:hypothetical protein
MGFPLTLIAGINTDHYFRGTAEGGFRRFFEEQGFFNYYPHLETEKNNGSRLGGNRS